MFGRKVRVRFLSADGGAPIGEVELAPEKLPESFEARTTFELGGESWQVVEAEPMTRAGYAKTRRLTIVLRKLAVVHCVPTNDILFSLPTINDALPAIAAGSTKLGKNVLELHEDDWRQIELVSRALGGVVDSELAAVQSILDKRTGAGFQEIHIRKQPTSPLGEGRFGVDAVARALPGARMLDGVAFSGGAGLVAHGFAVDGGDVRAFGLVEGGVVTTLGLQHSAAVDPRQFAAFATAHDLMIVDWCRARVLAST